MEGGYRPRFGLDPSVIRLPIVPGSDPRTAYGDLVQRGVKGVVLEAYGEVSNALMTWQVSAHLGETMYASHMQ